MPPVPGFVATAVGTAGNLDKKGADGKASIIDAQESEQFLDDRTDKANTRLPYNSTLIQLGDDDVTKMESLEERDVPLDFKFVKMEWKWSNNGYLTPFKVNYLRSSIKTYTNKLYQKLNSKFDLYFSFLFGDLSPYLLPQFYYLI